MTGNGYIPVMTFVVTGIFLILQRLGGFFFDLGGVADGDAVANAEAHAKAGDGVVVAFEEDGKVFVGYAGAEGSVKACKNAAGYGFFTKFCIP